MSDFDKDYQTKKLKKLSEQVRIYTKDENFKSIETLIKTLNVSKWISVKDRYPDSVEGVKVLGHNGDYIFECEYNEGFWCSVSGKTMTHWMQPPQLPKESE